MVTYPHTALVRIKEENYTEQSLVKTLKECWKVGTFWSWYHKDSDDSLVFEVLENDNVKIRATCTSPERGINEQEWDFDGIRPVSGWIIDQIPEEEFYIVLISR